MMTTSSNQKILKMNENQRKILKNYELTIAHSCISQEKYSGKQQNNMKNVNTCDYIFHTGAPFSCDFS